jgi:hypothetical protein
VPAKAQPAWPTTIVIVLVLLLVIDFPPLHFDYDYEQEHEYDGNLHFPVARLKVSPRQRPPWEDSL